jgi:hypothetical protein
MRYSTNTWYLLVYSRTLAAVERAVAAAASTSEPLQHFFQPQENRERVR